MKVMLETLTIYLCFLSRMEFSPKRGEKKNVGIGGLSERS